MRISHTALDDCLKNPRQWYASTRVSSSHPYKMGYARLLQLSVYHYHRSSASDARKYLAAKIIRHRFKNATKVSEIENGLESYIVWATSEQVRTAGVQIKISLTLGFLELRGELSRVDVTKSGYRAILFGKRSANWQNQLRMPLIQLAVSGIYARPAHEIDVGFQGLDGTSLQTISYEPKQLEAARERLQALGRTIGQFSKSKQP